MKALVLALALGAAPLAAQVAADTGAKPVSLDQAIRMAQAAAPANVASRGALETGSAALTSAYLAFVPTLSLNVSSAANNPVTPCLNSQTGQLVAGKWNFTEGFSMGVTIFNGGQRLYTVAAARALLGASEAADVAQRYQTAYNVKVQYYAVLASREQQIAAHAALDAAVQQMKVSVANVKARTVTKSDSLKSLVAVGNAKLQVLAADLAIQAANATLTRLVAAPTTVTASLADTTAAPMADIDSVAVARLALVSPSVRQAQASFDAASASAQAARGVWFPNITASYSRNITASDSQFLLSAGGGSASGALRFSLSYPIFNQWQRESSILSADVAKRNAEAQSRDAKYAAQESLVQDVGALRTALEQANIQTTSVAAAEEDLRVQQEQYRLGVSTILDVLTSQSSLNAARLLLIQARFNYRVAKAQLEALVGSDL